MPGGVLPYQDHYISPELLKHLRLYDFRIGTLESAIGNDFSFDPIKMAGRQNIIFARNEDLFRVKEMGFDVVSLANNHIWDLGEEGFKNTIRLLNDNGIKYCGAGRNAKEAALPAVIEKDGIRVAIFAYCMYNTPWLGYVELATEEKAGVNPLDIDKAVFDIRKAKKEYDMVIVMPHWGREYQYEPLPECIQMAKRMINAGADAVLGSHPHQIQPLVQYKGKPICFSMGNFLFPDFYMRPPRPIWYPDSIDEVQGVEVVVGYPFPIDRPIKQVWNSVSRFGCMVDLEFEKQKRIVCIQYVCSSDNNVEMFAELPRAIHYQLKRTRKFISNTPYRMIVYGLRIFRRVFGKIYRKLLVAHKKIKR